MAYLTFGGTGSYKKVKWYQYATFHTALFGLTGILFLSMLMVWPFIRHGHWSAWVISLVNLIFLVGIGMLFGGGTDLLIFFKTIPIDTHFLLMLPWISGVMTLWLLLMMAQMWKNTEKSGGANYTIHLSH